MAEIDRGTDKKGNSDILAPSVDQSSVPHLPVRVLNRRLLTDLVLFLSFHISFSFFFPFHSLLSSFCSFVRCFPRTICTVNKCCLKFNWSIASPFSFYFFSYILLGSRIQTLSGMAGEINSLINLTWSLNETVGGLITIGKGYLQAANEDNVQPLAILAAERFGATLAIAQESCRKTELEASRSHTTMTIKFLKATIGYSGSDTAAQLAKSGAGVRFLALASSLICLPSYETAAKALDLMMASTAGVDQMLPSLGQLEDLLKALEPKLIRVAFSARLMYWTDFISNWRRQRGLSLGLGTEMETCPSEKELQNLINTFRRVKRLGEVPSEAEDPKFVTITARAHFSWVVAFVEWCNGVSPNIVLDDHILPSNEGDPFTRINLKSPPDPQNGSAWAEAMPKLEIRTSYSLNRLDTLWNSGTSDFNRFGHYWRGMISVQDHGRRWMRVLESETGIKFQVLYEVLFIALSLVAGNLRAQIDGTVDDALTFSFLPTASKLVTAFGSFIDEEPPSKLLNTKDFKSLYDVPIIKERMEHLCGSPLCQKCKENPSMDHCNFLTFEQRITAISSDIISIARFDCAEPIQVMFRPSRYESRYRHGNRFEAIVHTIIFHQKARKPTQSRWSGNEISKGILQHCRELVGHDIQESSSVDDNGCPGHLGSLVVSSSYGQVFFHSILDSMILDGGNLCCLTGGAGQLRYKGIKYECVREDCGYYGPYAVREPTPKLPVDRPCNLFKPKDFRIPWKIELRSRYIKVSFRDDTLDIGGTPMACLSRAFGAIFVAQCGHDEDAHLDEPDVSAFYVTQFQTQGYSLIGEHSVPVVAVSGNEHLRFMALMSGVPTVVRGNACLECCLAIRKKEGYECVIA